MVIDIYFIIFIFVFAIRSLLEMIFRPKNINSGNGKKGLPSLIIFITTFFIVSLSVGYFILTENILNAEIFYTALTVFIILSVIRIKVARKMKHSYNLYIIPTKKSQLITTGANSIVRHPIYALYTLEIAALLLARFNYIGLIALIINIIGTLLRIRDEEKLLTERYKSIYVHYKEKVKYKIIPFIY